MQIVNQPGVHRTMRNALLSIVILGALLLGALPAQAASRYEWSDPKGDATGLGLGGGMTPNDPQFDITKAAVSSHEGVFTYAASVKALSAGKPSGSTGYFFALAFTYAGANYWFVVSENFWDDPEFRLWNNSTDAGCIVYICPTPWPRLTLGSKVGIPCGGCHGVIDRKKNQVIVTAPIASLTAATDGMRAGSKLTDLYVLSQRRVGYDTLTSDEAAAPKGVAFKL